jgi:hypothetical protein
MDAPLPDAKKYSECSITLCGSEMIQKQLLVSLSDKSKVACIFDRDDLDAMVAALRFVPEPHTLKQKMLLHDLLQLRRAAFNVPLPKDRSEP